MTDRDGAVLTTVDRPAGGASEEFHGRIGLTTAAAAIGEMLTTSWIGAGDGAHPANCLWDGVMVAAPHCTL
jgi:hypothetical protein